MSANVTILLVSADPKLRREVDSALGALEDISAVVHQASEVRQGLEMLRGRRPTLALIEMGRDLRPLELFAEEAAHASHETAVAAVFSAEVFGHDISESAVLIAALRAGVRDFLRRPLSTADLGQLLDRLVKPAPAGPAHIGAITAFMSNKGGVGKSTLAINTACGLATRHPGRVLMIDASLQLGVTSAMLDLKPATSLTDAVRERDRLDETLLRQLAVPHPCGLHLLTAPADAVEAAQVTDEVMARVLTLGRRAYDHVIVDCFPLLDGVMIAILDLCDRAYLVLESVVPTVLGAAKLLQVLETLGFPAERQRVIINRYSSFAGNLKPEDVSARLQRSIDHVIPYQKKLLIAANLGKPYILTASGWFSRFVPALWKLVDEVEAIKPVGRPARATRPTK